MNGHGKPPVPAPPLMSGIDEMGPNHGERIAVLESLHGGLASSVAETRLDIKKLSEKVDVQYTDLKTTFLTKTVQSATRAAVWKDIGSRAGWLIAQAVIVLAAVIGALHVK